MRKMWSDITGSNITLVIAWLGVFGAWIQWGIPWVNTVWVVPDANEQFILWLLSLPVAVIGFWLVPPLAVLILRQFTGWLLGFTDEGRQG